MTQEGLEHCASSLFEEGVVIITARGSIGKLVVVGNTYGDEPVVLRSSIKK